MGVSLCAFLSAFWLGKRKSTGFTISRCTERIDSTEKAANFFRKRWNKDLLSVQEEVYVIYVNRKYKFIAWERLHTGGWCSVPLDVSILAQHIVKHKPFAIFIAHNHPSGRTKPSLADKAMTQRVATLCKFMEIELSDHVIITKTKYLSFRERGFLD